MATDETNGLYGPEGSLARFTRAANGIHEIADKLRAQALPIRAKAAREALIAATAIDPSPEVRHYGRWVAEHACDETLAKLGRLLK